MEFTDRDTGNEIDLLLFATLHSMEWEGIISEFDSDYSIELKQANGTVPVSRICSLKIGSRFRIKRSRNFNAAVYIY